MIDDWCVVYGVTTAFFVICVVTSQSSRVYWGVIYAVLRPIMLTHYFSVLVFLGVALAVGMIALALGMVVGPRRPNEVKNSPYECGFPAFEDARLPFDVRYYLVAILFIVFDLETAFLFPWAVALRPVGLVAFC